MADAQAARVGLDQEQAQLGDALAGLDQEHAADARPWRSAIQHALALGIEVVDEFRDDAGDQRLEGHVPAVFGVIQRAVALDDPAEVAGRATSRSVYAGAVVDSSSSRCSMCAMASSRRCCSGSASCASRLPIWSRALTRAARTLADRLAQAQMALAAVAFGALLSRRPRASNFLRMRLR